MEMFAALTELAASITIGLGRVILWALFNPSRAAWPVAAALVAGLAVLGYRLYIIHPVAGFAAGIATLAVIPLRLYLVHLQKPRSPPRSVQRG